MPKGATLGAVAGSAASRRVVDDGTGRVRALRQDRGFLVALYGIYNLVFAMMQSTGLFGPVTYPLYQHVVAGLVFLGFGALLVRLAARIADFAYPLGRRRGE